MGKAFLFAAGRALALSCAACVPSSWASRIACAPADWRFTVVDEGVGGAPLDTRDGLWFGHVFVPTDCRRHQVEVARDLQEWRLLAGGTLLALRARPSERETRVSFRRDGQWLDVARIERQGPDDAPKLLIEKDTLWIVTSKRLMRLLAAGVQNEIVFDPPFPTAPDIILSGDQIFAWRHRHEHDDRLAHIDARTGQVAWYQDCFARGQVNGTCNALLGREPSLPKPLSLWGAVADPEHRGCLMVLEGLERVLRICADTAELVHVEPVRIEQRYGLDDNEISVEGGAVIVRFGDEVHRFFGGRHDLRPRVTRARTAVPPALRQGRYLLSADPPGVVTPDGELLPVQREGPTLRGW